MTISSTSLPKRFLLVFFCAFSFLLSNAQSRWKNSNRDRTPSDNRDHASPRHETPVNNNGNINPAKNPTERRRYNQPVTQNPDRTRRYPGYHPTPAPGTRDQAQRFPHVDRDFREQRRVHVSEAPRYAYYNNSYHHYYRSPVYSSHNPCWRYSYLPARRTVISSFPFSYETINYGGCGYRFYNGTYYRPYNSAYIVVAPPIGLSINILPFGYRRIYVRDNPYYYYNGTYYDDYNDSYRVVAPPLDAVVESIPPGYETVTIDGETYYKSDGVQYKPEVQDNGEIWYRVIKVDQ